MYVEDLFIFTCLMNNERYFQNSMRAVMINCESTLCGLTITCVSMFYSLKPVWGGGNPILNVGKIQFVVGGGVKAPLPPEINPESR